MSRRFVQFRCQVHGPILTARGETLLCAGQLAALLVQAQQIHTRTSPYEGCKANVIAIEVDSFETGEREATSRYEATQRGRN